MSYLVGNPEDRFSHGEAHIVPALPVSMNICRLQIIPLFGYSVQQYECGPLLNLDILHLIVQDATVLDVMYKLYHKNQQKYPADEPDEPGTMSNAEADDFMNMMVGHTFITRYRTDCARALQNQQNGMCTQQRPRSASTSAQSAQSLCCPLEETLGPWLSLEATAKPDQTVNAQTDQSFLDQTGWMLRLIRVFSAYTGHFLPRLI